MRWSAVLLLAATCTGVAGCGVDRVRSVEPLFSRADEATVRFRPGLWASPDDDCDFDPDASFKSWPECAHGRPFDIRGPGRSWHVKGASIVVRLAGGEPMILQTHIRFASMPTRAEDAEEGLLYEYGALRTTAADEQARVVAYDLWSVQCGPQQKERPAGDAAEQPTQGPPRDLPPGIVDDPKQGCLALEPAAVRSAARTTLERGWDNPHPVRWVRPFRWTDHFGRRATP